MKEICMHGFVEMECLYGCAVRKITEKISTHRRQAIKDICFCQSYYDEKTDSIKDCTCGKCAEELKTSEIWQEWKHNFYKNISHWSYFSADEELEKIKNILLKRGHYAE